MLAALCVTSNCLSTYRRLTHPVTASSLEPVNRLLKSRRYHPAIQRQRPQPKLAQKRRVFKTSQPTATIRGLHGGLSLMSRGMRIRMRIVCNIISSTDISYLSDTHTRGLNR